MIKKDHAIAKKTFAPVAVSVIPIATANGEKKNLNSYF